MDENLLGLDYLQRSKAVINLGTMSLAVKGSKIPLQGGDGKTQIVAIQATHILPLSEASLCCSLIRKMEGEGLVNPTPHQLLPKEIVVGQTLVLPHIQTQCMIANLSMEPRLVAAGAMQDTCQVVERMRGGNSNDSSLEDVTESNASGLVPLDGSFEELTTNDEVVLPPPTPPVHDQWTEEAGRTDWC